MLSTKLYRLSGIALLVGGLLVVIGVVLEFFNDETTNSTVSAIAILRLAGSILIATGLPGLYLRQASRVGNWGLLGFVAFFFYILMEGVAGDTINSFIVPYVASKAPDLLNDASISALDIYNNIGSLLGVIGGISLGITTWRAAILSRGASLVLIIGAVLYLIGSIVLPPLASIGVLMIIGSLAWFGQNVLSSLRESKPDLSVNTSRT